MGANARERRSRQWLQEALLQMMGRKPFQDITVTDVAERAGVSRLTFYRNFSSKEEVLTSYFDDLFARYLDDLGRSDAASLQAALCQCLEYWRSHAAVTRLLVRDGLEALIHRPFEHYLDQVIARVEPPISLSRTQKRFVVGGLFFVMLDWLDGDVGRAVSDVADQILSFVVVDAPDDNAAS